MTPPEKSESGTGVERTETVPASSAPPWQRVVKDGAGSEDARSAGQLAGPDVLYSSGNRAYDGEFHTGELPVVTGTAASRLFGDSAHADQRTSRETGSDSNTSKGHDTVDLASAGTRGRPATSALRRPGRGPRRASLQIKRFDPWSVLKLSLVLGVALFFVWMVAVGLLYTVLDGMGVWDKLNGTYSSLVSGEGTDSGADPLITAGGVFGVAAIIGMINIVLLSALATVCAFIYNVSADLAGGLEVTLSERE